MCKEILSKHTMNVVRPDAADVLMPIKRGEWSYEKLMDVEQTENAALAELYETSTLQSKPRVKEIEGVAIGVAKDFLLGSAEHQ